jgi:hypothetical protein
MSEDARQCYKDIAAEKMNARKSSKDNLIRRLGSLLGEMELAGEDASYHL